MAEVHHTKNKEVRGVDEDIKLLKKKQAKIVEINKYGKTGSRGYSEIINFLNGKKLSPLQSIRGECYDCMGFFMDGVGDCKNPMCVLYPFMPFSPKIKDPRKVEAGRKRALLTGFGSKSRAHDKTS